jgi:hypothetical protein
MPRPRAHAAAVDVPETHYARRGGYHIAYQTLGEGPPDVAYLSGWFSHIEARCEVPPWEAFMRRISSFGD